VKYLAKDKMTKEQLEIVESANILKQMIMNRNIRLGLTFKSDFYFEDTVKFLNLNEKEKDIDGKVRKHTIGRHERHSHRSRSVRDFRRK
jgi:hypothetical protein